MIMLLRDAIKGLLDETKHHEVASELLVRWVPVYLWYQACSAIAKQSACELFLGNSLTMQNFNTTCLTQHNTLRNMVHFDNTMGDYKITVGRKVYRYITKEEQPVLSVQPFIDPTFWADIEDTKKF
jgi:hypothetical protein